MSETPPLPTFIVIGGHRCATRWLRNNLDAHPDIHVPWSNESYFSDRSPGTGLRGYRLQFRDAEDATVIGDVSPELIARNNHPAEVCDRIMAVLPDIRLVAVVRQPVDRMVSAHRDHVIHGRLEPNSSLFEMVRLGQPEINRYDLVGGGLYAANLRPFWRRFGDQLLIVAADDIRDDPAKVYDAVLRHIDAPVGFVPPHLDRVLYSNAASRWSPGSELDDEQRRSLHMLFRRDIEELEAMTGRYLPGWDPGPPPPGWSDSIALAVPNPLTG